VESHRCLTCKHLAPITRRLDDVISRRRDGYALRRASPAPPESFASHHEPADKCQGPKTAHAKCRSSSRHHRTAAVTRRPDGCNCHFYKSLCLARQVSTHRLSEQMSGRRDICPHAPAAADKCPSPGQPLANAERPRQMPKPLPICRAAKPAPANAEALRQMPSGGIAHGKWGGTNRPVGRENWLKCLPLCRFWPTVAKRSALTTLPLPGQMSARSAGSDKCPHPPAVGTNVRRPGQMSELKNPADKCPSRKSRRTNVQARNGRRQMPETLGKCRVAKPPPANAEALDSRRQVPGPSDKVQRPSANAEAPAGPRQMPTARTALGKCRAMKTPPNAEARTRG
jgi:hypothetical protein